MNWDFQPGMHPDADQLSVFVEGVTSAREHDRMLAHLAECVECRKAVFLMQPHEEPQRATATPVKGWIWRWLVPVGLPAAALACLLIAVLIHIRPRGGAPAILQENARVSQPEIQLPRTVVPPIISSEGVARSGNPRNAVTRNAAPPNLSRQEEQHFTAGSNLSKSKSRQTAANVGSPQIMAAAPASVVRGGAVGGPSGGVSGGVASGGGIGGGAGGGVLKMQTPLAAAQNTLPEKKDLPTLGGAIEQDAKLAGVSGHITDRSGAVIAGATVSVRDASGKTRQTTTDTDGSFHLTELPAGQYEVIATASNFKTSKQSIELKPSELAMLEPVLDVGTASQTVEVTAASPLVQADSAELRGTVTGRNMISLEPGIATVSHGKRFLCLDSAGNLSLSRDRGKKWRKINPQWAGKAVRIELTSAHSSEAPTTAKNQTGPASKGAIFQLTTDTGAVWTSKDGTHWRQQ